MSQNTQMSLLKQLIDEGKKPSIKRSAKAVYHRDYVKTRNKPYRKYDPDKHVSEAVDDLEGMSIAQLNQELEYALEDLAMAKEVGEDQDTINEIQSDVNALRAQIDAIRFHTPRMQEGAFDFAIGAGKHVGDKLKQGVDSVVQAGRTASAQGDLKRDLQALATLLSTYDKLKPQQRVEPTMASEPQADQPGGPTGAPDAFRTTDKPRFKAGAHGPEYTFSSYLYNLDDQSILSEGVMDFLKGAGRHVANSIGQATNNVVQAGKQASQTADLERVTVAAKQKVKEIVQRLSALGPQAGSTLQQLAADACGPQSKRCIAVITKAAQKMGIQL